MVNRMLRLGAVLGTVIALLCFGAVAPARAGTGDYVALGDSFSAGVGTRNAVDSCYRSPYGYPALIADRHRLTLDYQACSGATTADVGADQLETLSAATGLVSITIGGNDAGYVEVLTECALPSWMSDCAGVIADGRAVVAHQLPGRYDSLFSAIRSKAPNAEIVVGGYPLLFNGEDCNWATFFGPREQASLNSATGELDDLIAAKSDAYGFGFVDPSPAFRGHAVCDAEEWINGLSYPIRESYHPNRAGNVGYAQVFSPALTGAPYPAASAVTPARSLGRVTQRPLSLSKDRTTVRDRADAVLALDLDSPENLARARQHGIAPGQIVRLVAHLRSPHPDTVQQALNELRRLDRQLD